MATLIQETITDCAGSQPVLVHVERHTLYKRRWRASAANGTELAVDLEAPVSDGTILKATTGELFRLKQLAEDVLIIALPKTTEMAAQIGWYLGNQHLPVEVRSDALILEKLDTLAASLDRIGIPYTFKHDVFHCKMHSHQH